MHILLAAVDTSNVSGTPAQRLQSLAGLIVFTVIAFAIGRLRGSRGPLPVRTIVWGFVLQFLFGAIVLFAPADHPVLTSSNIAVLALVVALVAGVMASKKEAVKLGTEVTESVMSYLHMPTGRKLPKT